MHSQAQGREPPAQHHDLVVLPVGDKAVLHRACLGLVEPLVEIGLWATRLPRVTSTRTRANARARRAQRRRGPEPEFWAGTMHRICPTGARVVSWAQERLVERELRDGAVVSLHERSFLLTSARGERIRFCDMAYHQGRLFLAGLFHHEGEWVPLLEAMPDGSYVALPVPKDAAWKHVDLLVGHAERLIAVDDDLSPRWLYDYDFVPEPPRGRAKRPLRTPDHRFSVVPRALSRPPPSAPAPSP